MPEKELRFEKCCFTFVVFVIISESDLYVSEHYSPICTAHAWLTSLRSTISAKWLLCAACVSGLSSETLITPQKLAWQIYNSDWCPAIQAKFTNIYIFKCSKVQHCATVNAINGVHDIKAIFSERFYFRTPKFTHMRHAHIKIQYSKYNV